MHARTSAVSPTAANLAGSLRAGIVRYGPSTYLAAGAVQGRSPGTVAAPVGSRRRGRRTPLQHGIRWRERDVLGFGSHGPHGSTLILYPAIVSLHLYRSQTNCERAKHQRTAYGPRIISDLVNLYSLELYRHFQSEFIFVDVTCACRSRQMFGSYTLGRGNFRRLASIQQLCGLRMCRPSDLKITKVCSSGGKPRSKHVKTTPPNDIIKPRLNWGGLMLLRVLLHIRLYPLREKMPRAMRKAVLVLCNEVCRTLCRLDARAR